MELFGPSSKNKKNICPEKIFNPNIKKFLTFSQGKAFLIFQEIEPPKKFLIFSQQKAVLIFQETETPK